MRRLSCLMVFSLVGVAAAASWRDVGLLAAVTMPLLACWNAFVNHVQQPHQAPSSPASCDAGVYSGFAHRYGLEEALAELKKDAQDALDAERRSVPAHCPTSGPDGGEAAPARLRRRRFRLNKRTRVPHNWHACRGTELGIKGHRIEAHLLILATFRDLLSAKAVITYTVALVYGAEAQEARRGEGLVGKPRLFSQGAIALVYVVDAALDARSAVGDDGEVGGDTLAAIGEWFFEVGLVEVNGAGDLVDGPRIRPASAALRKQHPSDHSEALKSLAIESVLGVWQNLVMSDAEMRARVPEMVLSLRLNDKTKHYYTLRPAQVYAHCFWGAFGMVAPSLFPDLLENFWADGAGRLLELA